MASQANQLHFALFPFMAQGHMIPMIDIAKLLAHHGVIVTIFTTPTNADRFKLVLTHAVDSGLQIRLVQLRFPCQEVGLPEGTENLDLLPSEDVVLYAKFLAAANRLLEPAKKVFEELKPKPNCIISDGTLYYTLDIANYYHIPRISFHGFCCFSLLCHYNLAISKVHHHIASESEQFAVPNMPEKVEFTRSQLQLPRPDGSPLTEFNEKMAVAEKASYGVIINTFEELEQACVKEYKKVREDKMWCIGPVSLWSKDKSDKAQRGNNASPIDEHRCIKWLDSQEVGSVVYACLGSLCHLEPLQLLELGLGLEAPQKPFLWVIRGKDQYRELEKWIEEEGFEERTKGRGLVIRGWAPQVLILSHPAIGGFLTHCGWNSTLEGIAAGVPLITWPLFAEQFMNEKFVVQLLQSGVTVVVQEPTSWVKTEKVPKFVNKENVKTAIDRLMDESKEGEERRTRARKLGEMAKKAVENGGSSHLNIKLLIQDIILQTMTGKST